MPIFHCILPLLLSVLLLIPTTANASASQQFIDGGYIDMRGGLPLYNFYTHDYQGNIRVSEDISGIKVERYDYYPYGALFGETSPSQDYLYGGKEWERTYGMNHYDFHARWMNPLTTRFTTQDPLQLDYAGLSSYSYCAGNPIIYIDPTGEDVEICIENNNIIINANIILEGSLATTDLAKIYKDDIMKNWGNFTSFEYGGQNYEITWNIDVRVAKKEEQRDFNGINNYFVVTDETEVSKVINSNNGFIRGKGRNGKSLETNNPMSHEFGHILGLRDKYNTNKNDPNYGKPINPSWDGNIMAESAGKGSVSTKNMNTLLIPAIIRHSIINSIFNRKDNTKYYINSRNREPIQQ